MHQSISLTCSVASGKPGSVPVERVASAPVLQCGPDTPVFEAAQAMQRQRFSSIVISRNGAPLGIWTERDALALDLSDPGSALRPIRDVMSAPVKTVALGTPLDEVAIRFRRERLRHFVVVDTQGHTAGVVSQSDVVLNQGIEHYLHLRTVASVLTQRARIVDAAAPMTRAAAAMRESGSDAVVVAFPDGGFGIVTERDVVRHIGERRADLAVEAVASRPLLTVAADATLYRVRSLLGQRAIRHVGVLGEDAALVGLVSFSDILSGLELAYVDDLKHALAERDRALSASRRSLHLTERVINASLEGIMITDARGRIESVNPAFTRLTGYSGSEAVGQSPALLSSGRHGADFYHAMWQSLQRDGYWQGEIWNRRKDGEIFPERLTITAIHGDDGEVTHYAALFSDITELKENEERIRSLAYFDPLTRLPNRRLLYDRLHVAIAHARRHRQRLALMFVDLDRFKRVNDSLGHSVGDRLLVSVAERLVHCLREDDTVARTGGDEFVVLLSEVDHVENIAATARRINDALKAPLLIEGEELVVTSSIGIAIYPDDADSLDGLVQNADAAMYRAKDAGRNSYQLYSPAMNARSLEFLALEMGLRKAIERQEFLLYYQPIVDAASGRTIGAEALLRWRHPELGLIPPADFIPLAEDNGLIIPIGDWVLREASRQVTAWAGSLPAGFRVAVNLSARQFRQADFLQRLEQAVAEGGAHPPQLVLELTESLLVEDAVETIRTMSALRARGFDISVDDFGTGYSSLSYLKRFPIGKLKIDRAFIREIHANADDAAIVSAVISLGHSLGLEVVAEGVEKREQLALLIEHGCEQVQGFLFSEPLPAAGFAERFLR